MARKSVEEVQKLKSEWLYDGTWDIEETPGFEEYHDELLIFRLEKELAFCRDKLKEYETFFQVAKRLIQK